MPDPLRDYLAAIQRELAIGKTTEHKHRSALKALIEAWQAGATATNESGRGWLTEKIDEAIPGWPLG